MPDKKVRSRRKRRQTKDRVLQARIPEQLDDELRDQAEQLGLSVSTIVRNVLLNTFDLVEGVVSDSAQIARALKGRESSSSPTDETLRLTAPVEPEAEVAVIGWQELVLNKNGICDQCNTILAVGQRAAIAVPNQPRPVLLCPVCLAALSPVTGDSPASAETPDATL